MNKEDIPTVAVGIDLGPTSEAVASAGLRIAQALGGRCVLLHSMITTPAVSSYERALSRLDILAHSTANPLDETRLDFEILSGAPANTLNEWAESVDADVLVVGVRQNVPRFERTFATIDGLLRRANRPIWAIRPDQHFPPKHPLFAVSSAESSDLAVETGLAHLETLGWANEPVFASAIDSPMECARAQQRLRRIASQSCRETPTLRVGQGRPVAVLEEILVSERCDLLVAGSGVPRGWSRFRFGSVASDLAYRSHCHVLLIPEGAGRCYRAAKIGDAREHRDTRERAEASGPLHE